VRQRPPWVDQCEGLRGGGVMTWEINTGHVLDVLAGLEPECVQTCVTSPPYWGLRDYGDGGQDWPAVSYSPMPGLPPLDIPAQTVALGLEPDPWAYVGHLVEVFRAVRRVLRDDGTLWLNLGDSYAATSKGSGGTDKGTIANGQGQKTNRGSFYASRFELASSGLKPKDLCGIPWRVAYALQADGWYLRSDIIWAKPNPMPESVTDRPTKAHEYLFLLSKRPRYYYDADAIKREESGPNRRSVWTITTRPYSAAHFATFPPDLPERCIKAGTSEHGCCETCRAPWARDMEIVQPGTREEGSARAVAMGHSSSGPTACNRAGEPTQKRTIGWTPGCACGAGQSSCLVLDPFSGAGTTGMVARRLQRSYVGIEQSPEYADMSRRRIESDAPLFNRCSS